MSTARETSSEQGHQAYGCERVWPLPYWREESADECLNNSCTSLGVRLTNVVTNARKCHRKMDAGGRKFDRTQILIISFKNVTATCLWLVLLSYGYWRPEGKPRMSNELTYWLWSSSKPAAAAAAVVEVVAHRATVPGWPNVGLN